MLARTNPSMVSMEAKRMTTGRELIESGVVMPSVERTYPLVATAEALHRFGNKHARGKFAIFV